MRSVLYARFPRLLEDLELARGDGRIARKLKSLGQVELLNLDDRGIQPLRVFWHEPPVDEHGSEAEYG